MSHYAAYDPRPSGAAKLDALCIRVARPEDAPRVLEISREREERRPDEDVADQLSRVQRELESLGLGHNVFVAEVEGAVVAFGRVRKLDHAEAGLPRECPEGWYLTGVVVRPSWRRRGLGARF